MSAAYWEDKARAAWELVKKLEAEVAALREERDEWVRNCNYAMNTTDDVRRELSKARALLARWEDVHCAKGHGEAHYDNVCDETEDFLARASGD